MKNILKMALLAGFMASPFVYPMDAVAQDKSDIKAEEAVNTFELLGLFGDVFERVRSDYVEETTDQELIEAAISGMLKELDPHSSYMTAKNFREMQVQTRGEFGGLGIRVTLDKGLIKVISPIDDTPAFRAGIEPGDYITHLDDEPVLGLSLQKAVEKMRGRVGTDIKLGIQREGRDPFDVTLTRAVVQIKSVRQHMEADGIGYVRITSFSEKTSKHLKEGIAKLKEESKGKMKGLVLDLRNNPGGLLDQAVEVSDIFLEKGEIVSTRSRKAEETKRFNARPGDLTNGLPVVVMVNTGSASASEIVAGALQDHRRAIILGTKTFGKGSVQTIIPLAGHGAMRLTTSRYYTPSGKSIQAVGIEPDIVVEQSKIESLENGKSRREADLRGALENGDATEDAIENDGDKEKQNKKKPAAKDKKPADYQLLRAVDLLKGIALFSQQAAK